MSLVCINSSPGRKKINSSNLSRSIQFVNDLLNLLIRIHKLTMVQIHA